MQEAGSQKSAQNSKGDNGEATKAAAARRPGIMLEQHGDEINKREEETKKRGREEEEKLEVRREALSQDADSTTSRRAELKKKKKIYCALAEKNY